MGIEFFQNNPIEHVKRIQGVTTLEKYQADILDAIRDNERTSVAACHNMGKTWVAAKTVTWFLTSYPRSKVITTAPTLNQVKRLLWAEIHAGFTKAPVPLGGELKLTEWKIAADWFAIGFTSKPGEGGGDGTGGQGISSSFQGFHAPKILIVFDEATGISKAIWDQVEGMLTSGFVRFLAIGNPTSKACEFYRTFQSFSFKKIYISCFESPNLIANGLTDIQSLVRERDYLLSLNDEDREKRLASYKIVSEFLLSTRWVMGRAIDWGIDHPLFISKVLGRFPDEDDNALFHLGSVEEAQRREGVKTGFIAIGVDVARYGIDKTVITIMDGTNVRYPKVLMRKDSSEIAGEIIQMVNTSSTAKTHGCTIAVDETGVGAGVVDRLRDYKNENKSWAKVNVLPVNFGAGFDKEPDHLRDQKKKKYVNRKAEIFLALSSAVKTVLSLPEENIYLEELPTIIYKLNAKGQYVIESKDDYKKRTGRGSPDHADSLALANHARLSQNSFSTPIDLDLDIRPAAGNIRSEVPW